MFKLPLSDQLLLSLPLIQMKKQRSRLAAVDLTTRLGAAEMMTTAMMTGDRLTTTMMIRNYRRSHHYYQKNRGYWNPRNCRMLSGTHMLR